MALIDAYLLLSSAQAITSAAASTNIIDLGVAGRDIANGKTLYAVTHVTTTMTDSSSNSTVAITLEQDDASSFGSATSLDTLYTIPAISAAGYVAIAALDPKLITERFIRFKYTPANGNLSAGAFTSYITPDPDAWRAAPKGYTGPTT